MTPSAAPRRLRLLATAALLAAAATLGGALSPIGVPAAHAALGAGGEYHPVTPVRVLDTRSSGSSPTGARGFGAANAFEVQLSGAATITGGPSGVPADGVLAVVVSITVAGTNRSGYLTAYPSGTAQPDASNVNFLAGQDASNLALLRPGSNGKATIVLDGASSAGGSSHVIIDIVGWFSSSTSPTRGARLISLAPGRILDTRSGVGSSGTLGPGASITLPVRGADAVSPSRVDYVPNDPNVAGVILNVTATGPTASTFISLQPDPFSSFPTTSSVNLLAGRTKANLVMVPIAADGSIRIFNESGNVHVIADVVGYFRNGVVDESTTGRIVPLTSPFRALDTRKGEFGAAKLGSGQEEPWDFASFVQSVKLDGVWVGDVDSLLLNFTAADLSFPYAVSRTDTFLTMYPGGTTLPGSSNLNLVPSQGAVPNFAVARLSAADTLNVYNDNGFVHYLADVAAVVLQ